MIIGLHWWHWCFMYCNWSFYYGETYLCSNTTKIKYIFNILNE